MQQTRGQSISLQQPGTFDRYNIEDPDDLQLSSVSPHLQQLQHTLEVYIFKPKTRKGQIICWAVWLVAIAAGCVMFWQVLPRFVDHGNHAETIVVLFVTIRPVSPVPLDDSADWQLC